MYYEEKLINGVWHFRGTPTGNWEIMSNEMINRKLTDAKTELNNLRLVDISNCFTAEQMKEAFHDGERNETGFGDSFDINNYC